ncbi:MAG: translation elongation factor Ts [bacterium]|nr:translation elongation factor Ts [bacterium]
MVDIELIKKFREATGVSISECKKALEEAGGDFDKAKDILREWGRDLAGRKNIRTTFQGIIESYIHPNKRVGVLLELSCETDFAAQSKDFQELAHELCLQIAAMGEETPLMEQGWVKDQKKTVKELIDQYIAKIGENIAVKQFIRYAI